MERPEKSKEKECTSYLARSGVGEDEREERMEWREERDQAREGGEGSSKGGREGRMMKGIIKVNAEMDSKPLNSCALSVLANQRWDNSLQGL